MSSSRAVLCIYADDQTAWPQCHSFSRLLKQLLTQFPKLPFFQVRMKLSTENHSFLLKNQTFTSDMTHKPPNTHTHYNTVSHTGEINSKQYYKKLHMMNTTKDTRKVYISTFFIPECAAVQYNTPNDNKKSFCPSIMSFKLLLHLLLFFLFLHHLFLHISLDPLFQN